MSRRNKPPKRMPPADPIYHDQIVAKFINRLMTRGKKSLSEKIFYGSMKYIEDKTKKEAMEVFHKALQNVTPLVEVKARRIGGSTYQVPIEVDAERGTTLASVWIIKHARSRGGKGMIDKLSNEILDAYNNTGISVKKKEDTHKMAEANKAFAHYRY